MLNRYSITNDGPIEGNIVKKLGDEHECCSCKPNFVITDLSTGKIVEDVTGFYLEVDQPNGKVFLTLRKDDNLVKSNMDFATPNHGEYSSQRNLVGLYDI